MLSRTNPSPSCPSTLSRTSQGTPRSSSVYACAAISRGRSARVCHTNICPTAPSLLALRLTDNKTRPFAEVDLTTLLSRQPNASPCHHSQFSRTSHGTLRPFVFAHMCSHSLPQVDAFMDFESYTQTLCSADTKRNAVAYLLEARWGIQIKARMRANARQGQTLPLLINPQALHYASEFLIVYT
jgi:hypothetical protein